MTNAHRALISLGKKLGYTDKDTGLCYGTTLRFLEACLLGEQEKFIRRMNTIAKTDGLDVLITQAKEKVKQHQALTPYDLDLLDVLSFYDSLFLYHTPAEYAQVFNEKNLRQMDIDNISRLACSDRIQAEGGLTAIYSESNSYTKNKINDYLTDIQSIISDNSTLPENNLGMLLSSQNHAIGLFYQAECRKWLVMDINQWPPVEPKKRS